MLTAIYDYLTIDHAGAAAIGAVAAYLPKGVSATFSAIRTKVETWLAGELSKVSAAAQSVAKAAAPVATVATTTLAMPAPIPAPAKAA